MRKKGSITVFLALVLVLLFSFFLTVLEGARLQGATAYVTMLNRLAGNSFLATYYFPLFEDYGIFGVDGGYGATTLSEKKTEEWLKRGISYGTQEQKGGLFSFSEPQVELLSYRTLLTGEGKEFCSQVKEQVFLSGGKWMLSQMFAEEQLRDAAAATEIYVKQQEALEGTMTVTKEILRLMELVDGIRTTEQGLWCDREGRLSGNGTFIKRIAPMSREELEEAYGNEEIFACVQSSFRSSEQLATLALELVEHAILLEKDIAGLDEVLNGLDEEMAALETEKQRQEELRAERKTVAEERDLLVEELDLVLMDAEEHYMTLQEDTQGVIPLLENVLKILDVLEEKQWAAQAGVETYEAFLSSMKGRVSEELYQIFDKELIKMKSYLGMDEQGYYVPWMRRSIQKDIMLVSGICRVPFQGEETELMQKELQAAKSAMAQYTVEGLWFTYGEVCVTVDTGISVKQVLQSVLNENVLSFVGLEEDKVSQKKLDGRELPSDFLGHGSVGKEIAVFIEHIKALLGKKDIAVLMKELEDGVTDMAALELYAEQQFGSFTEPEENTRISYEREYLLFGNNRDADNLTAMVLYLVAIRTMLSMVSLLKNTKAMAEIQTLAATVAGMTGIPLLLSITKYALLFLWSLEEAFVEAAGLLQGKYLPLLSGEPRVLFEELFLFRKELVAEKSAKLPENGAGAGYSEYLMLLSALQSTKKKEYFMMDLIQENMRFRYRDSFRIRNVITDVEFQTEICLEERFDTGIFPAKTYQLQAEERCGY